MSKFEIGKTYTTRSVCNHELMIDLMGRGVPTRIAAGCKSQGEAVEKLSRGLMALIQRVGPEEADKILRGVYGR